MDCTAEGAKRCADGATPMRFAIASAGLLLLAVTPLVAGSSVSEECVSVKLADTEVCLYKNGAGDTCLAVHRGEWIHVTRCAPLSALALEPLCAQSATGVEVCTDGGCVWGHVGDRPLSACPTAGATASALCTYDIVESVSACVGGGCVTVFLGPSARQVCAGGLIGDVGPLCTYDLIESVSACYDDGCASVYLGPSERRVCAPPVVWLA